MARCSFIKGNGERCKGSATGPHGLCWSHAPENAERRSRMASKAARSRPSKELAAVKGLVEALTRRVLGEEDAKPLETGRAAVANQLINTRLRAIELERKVKETDELEARIEELEQRSSSEQGGRAWGA